MSGKLKSLNINGTKVFVEGTETTNVIDLPGSSWVRLFKVDPQAWGEAQVDLYSTLGKFVGYYKFFFEIDFETGFFEKGLYTKDLELYHNGRNSLNASLFSGSAASLFKQRTYKERKDYITKEVVPYFYFEKTEWVDLQSTFSAGGSGGSEGSGGSGESEGSGGSGELFAYNGLTDIRLVLSKDGLFIEGLFLWSEILEFNGYAKIKTKKINGTGFYLLNELSLSPELAIRRAFGYVKYTSGISRTRAILTKKENFNYEKIEEGKRFNFPRLSLTETLTFKNKSYDTSFKEISNYNNEFENTEEALNFFKSLGDLARRELQAIEDEAVLLLPEAMANSNEILFNYDESYRSLKAPIAAIKKAVSRLKKNGVSIKGMPVLIHKIMKKASELGNEENYRFNTTKANIVASEVLSVQFGDLYQKSDAIDFDLFEIETEKETYVFSLRASVSGFPPNEYDTENFGYVLLDKNLNLFEIVIKEKNKKEFPVLFSHPYDPGFVDMKKTELKGQFKFVFEKNPNDEVKAEAFLSSGIDDSAQYGATTLTRFYPNNYGPLFGLIGDVIYNRMQSTLGWIDKKENEKINISEGKIDQREVNFKEVKTTAEFETIFETNIDSSSSHINLTKRKTFTIGEQEYYAFSAYLNKDYIKENTIFIKTPFDIQMTSVHEYAGLAESGTLFYMFGTGFKEQIPSRITDIPLGKNVLIKNVTKVKELKRLVDMLFKIETIKENVVERFPTQTTKLLATGPGGDTRLTSFVESDESTKSVGLTNDATGSIGALNKTEGGVLEKTVELLFLDFKEMLFYEPVSPTTREQLLTQDDVTDIQLVDKLSNLHIAVENVPGVSKGDIIIASNANAPVKVTSQTSYWRLENPFINNKAYLTFSNNGAAFNPVTLEYFDSTMRNSTSSQTELQEAYLEVFSDLIVKEYIKCYAIDENTVMFVLNSDAYAKWSQYQQLVGGNFDVKLTIIKPEAL